MIKGYSERDICTKLITPALLESGWQQDQFREEVKLTAGRVMVRGKIAKRLTDQNAKGGPKRADYVLYAMPYVPLATIEAKKNKFLVSQPPNSCSQLQSIKSWPSVPGTGCVPLRADLAQGSCLCEPIKILHC
tara:strand:- start:5053 stop:5451 length:399 start_codon:yes stop_codon:yes gene_type:complete